MTGLRVGSLCSGYGGLEMAVERVLPGARPVWYAEWNPDGDQSSADVLAYRWPAVPNHGDIGAIDYSAVEPVDVLTAGFPCQNISRIGDRAGMRTGTKSGIWSHVATAVRVLRPRLVLIENVRRITSAPALGEVEPCAWCVGRPDAHGGMRALGVVLADLAASGFDAQWTSMGAHDAGSCHRRERCWIAAWPAAADTPGVAQRTAPAEDLPVPGARGSRPVAGGRSLVALDRRWGRYARAVAAWGHHTGRRVPAPIDADGDLSVRFVEWMMGLPDGWVSAVPGISRAGALHALGNGVVPAQGALALRSLMAAAPPLRQVVADLAVLGDVRMGVAA